MLAQPAAHARHPEESVEQRVRYGDLLVKRAEVQSVVHLVLEA